jgi:hypothetical protein
MRRVITILIVVLLSTIVAQGQIKIGGNVYGGGNHANVEGSTKVTVASGDIGAVMNPNAKRPLNDPQGKVFGGARMANVGGNTLVHIDGKSDVAEGIPNYILINQVYGGNDIAGTIGTAKAIGRESVPDELKAVKATADDDYTKNVVDNTFNSYVRISTKVMTGANSTYTEEEIARDENDPEGEAYGKKVGDVKPDPNARKVYIGQLFAGGNGDFDYDQTPGPTEGKVTHAIYNWSDKRHQNPIAEVVTNEDEVGFQQPELDKTYLEVEGGSIVYAYGGGNNATVKTLNIIHVNNPSAVVNHIKVNADGIEDENGTDLLSTVRFKEMGINTTFSHPSSGAYQIGRFFGGNNKAEMHIRPTWNLLAGKVRNLYSGGNKGNMTSPEGLLLEIKDHSSLIVDNLFGGCRMADVMPTVNGVYTPCTNLKDKDKNGNLIYKFPNELSARTLVRGGHVNNVYGGNDVTGSVYGGNAVGIYTSVYGNVYGGGNGNYPYTDMETFKDHDVFGDFYYETPSGMTTGQALNAFRPNAEQVSIRLKGEAGSGSIPDYTIIHGSVFLGGNCATLITKKSNPLVELKMGSYVIADNVYLGNNGEGMIDENYLKLYAGNVNDAGEYVEGEGEGSKFSSLDLTGSSVFKRYMDGVAMGLKPNIVFDKIANGDPEEYIDYSSYIGSLYCGGNVGSMTFGGKETLTVNKGLNIYNKFVGGCNNANVAAGTYNAAYEGGVIGTETEQAEGGYQEGGKIKDRIEMNFENLTITPLRWNDVFTKITTGTLTKDKVYYTTDDRSSRFVAKGTEIASDENVYYELSNPSNELVWNTQKLEDGDFVKVPRDASDQDIRLIGGNVYGGCYESGHVNGNIVININQDMLKRNEVFGTEAPEGKRTPSGVNLEDQRDDLMAVALSLFGAGYGKNTEIWGSTTINHNNGYTFQIYGGGQKGVVGKKTKVEGEEEPKYVFDKAYSATVNLKGQEPVYHSDGTADDSAEAEYIYGGGNEGDVCGNTLVNLGNGRVYDAFGGASDADILGHAEVYIGRQPNENGGYNDAFPWINDIVYGGNDFGGTIHGAYEEGYNFEARVKDYDATKAAQLHGSPSNSAPGVLESSTYVEYLLGRVDTIFGGGYGSYDYTNVALYGAGSAMPKQHNAFVNIRPKDHAQNLINAVFGGGTGFPGNREDDKAQDCSYVLIDIPDGKTAFANMEAFGAGSYNGLGMKYTKDQTFADNFNLDEASAIVDLLHGRIKNAFGGSYQEGVTRRTVVNVPTASTIQIDNIFGGAYGKYILPPCDVYETQVNYKNTSENAQVFGAIFGGNNNERRSLFTQVNISSPVYSNKEKGYTGTIYGAGRGIDTWSEHTEVNLLSGAKVYEVYGGGEMGHVLNSASVQAYMNLYKDGPSQQVGEQDEYWKKHKDELSSEDEETSNAAKDRWKKDWKTAWTIDGYYNPDETWTDYANNADTNLEHVSNRAELDDKTAAQLDGAKKHNTNVIVHQGAVVDGYIYGGGLGDAKVALSGDVYGSTYAAVLGGEVKKDVYAGGRAGGLDNLFGADDFADPGNKFTATANAYVLGGTARNVYGGGYEGHVGHHDGGIHTSFAGDRPAESYVVIGKTGTNTYLGGAPAITRNVYGGGEGGSVYGTSHVRLNNGYIGYRYKNTGSESSPKYEYVEELDDQKPGDLDLSGNVFGGGYVVNSYVDNAYIDMYGGKVRGSLYGGGEIGPIGRGTIRYKDAYPDNGLVNQDARIFKAGQTHVKMYNGHVLRNVFGGGRGKDSWGGDGTMYMDKDSVPTLDLKVKGFVFGQTDVNIYGGEIGTNEGLASGYGNVFGGGDEGFVYSAYEQNGNLYIGNKSGVRYDKGDEGYYYKSNGTNFVNNAGTSLGENAEKFLTEDCHVLIEPWLQVKAPILYDGHTYNTGDYIPTDYLNTLPKKDKDDTSWPAEWNYVDAGSVVDEKYVERGVIIHNAVFAGGNIAVGSELYANTKTVLGNATASIHDVYNRDLITVGGIHIGGLYGDGNLTFVDGYRELNVTNYGTDYYNIKDEISNDVYKSLPPREQAYYELKYKCLKQCEDNEHTTYTPGTSIPHDELLVLFEGNGTIIQNGKPNPEYWTENGVVSRYAGRYLNTLQRADFCGVFGSRMVMKGAKDRVPEIEDATNYTINRVREVSLNKKASTAGDVGEFATHGNYFGIYSVVNYLGALTSDLNFYNDVRTTDNKDETKYKCDANEKAYGTATYADWKEQFHKDPRRNNGLSHNEVALASGVHLELTTEESTGNTLETKDWGIITGVVQLDLINVAKGIGGGFVYAKNIHGVRESSSKNQTILTDLNLHGGVGDTPAVTNRIYKYIETDNTASSTQKEWQTSGNFVHNTQIIIDDCYNITNRYLMGNRVPAHYWYIRGSVYVYDQYITAQTGSANAYSKNVELPITISAAAHNQMKLLDVQPNLYAYYSSYSSSSKTKLGNEQKLLIQDNEYYLNTPISYWDWYLLPASERNLFVEETYVTSEKCKIGNTIVSSDLVLLPSEYDDYFDDAEEKDLTPNDGKDNPVKAVIKVVQDDEGNDVVATDKDGNPIYVPFTSVFHSSNEMSHGTGYLLTYKMTNPKLWDTWYTEASSTTHAKRQETGEGYDNGPTYYLNTTEGQLLGQHEYKETDIIPQSLYNSYTSINTAYIPNYGKTENDEGYDASKKQATFEEAYVITAECSDANRHYYKGAPVSKTVGTSAGVSASPAYVCTGSIQLSATEYIFINDLMTYEEKEALKTKYSSAASDIDELIVPAYYCTSTGLYGGNYYEPGKNYRALEAWSAMSEADRANFTFNYDAFDLLIDENYGRPEGQKYQYDGQNFTTPEQAKTNPAQYSLETPIDYKATRDANGSDLALLTGQTVTLTRVENGVETKITNATSILDGDVLEREEFETKLLNEQYHYAPIDVTDDNKSTSFYVVKEAFYYKEPFAAGQVIDAETYNGLPNSTEVGGLNYQRNVDVLNFSTAGIYYYCRDSYTIDNTYGTVVTDINSGSHAVGSTVAVGTILSPTEYGKLKNQQLGFTISGVSPMETSTLYVSRNAEYDNLSEEKIITVIYQYDYEESDESGSHITPVSERHVVRIHVKFEDGIPSVEDIKEPNIVLPGQSILMRVPGVNSNGYEIIGGGWELFETKEDAESHFSGKEYTPSSEPLYWYQDDFYIAYYAKTYNRGKTYSNTVPVHVANYHDLKEVMDDKQYHLHVDYDRTRLKRDSKIYINDYSESSENGLDLFKNFYDLSIGTHLDGHNPLNISTAEGTNKYDGQTYQRGVKGGQNLEFFLRTDINHGPTIEPNPDYDPEDPESSETISVAHPWTTIGTDEQCFKGNLHGDGHTISGLDKSLFYNLCGNIYNLGVTGSFNTAGVVDKGTGYVESSWINTTGTPDGSVYAVFGYPSDTEHPEAKQMVNCYYQDGKNYKTTASEHGVATAKSQNAFYNGEVAYDLNNFYLYKRYCDHEVATSTDENNPQRYSYLAIGDDGELALQDNHCYTSNPSLCSTGYEYQQDAIMYVEDRYADGDFRYDGGNKGVIPDTEDERFRSWTVTENGKETVMSGFFPIWPDDYIFFGQKLNYGYDDTNAHQEVPTAVVRDAGRLSYNDDANRVYRAPAYYGSKEMSVAHFNPTVYLAQKEKLTDKQIEAHATPRAAYPNMTAIDFAGHNDVTYTLGANGTWFYQPLLDDDGLTSIQNCDETQNLLVYAPAASGESGYVNKKTHDVLTDYFVDPVYNEYYDYYVEGSEHYTDGKKYRRVEDATAISVKGHLVQSNLVATNDHLLVDKQDFNAPIAYDFGSDFLMWYQRKPVDGEFVDLTKGWQGISIPFTAELVTTNTKGEITHFFNNGGENSKGHEYWLRELEAGAMTLKSGETNVLEANFHYPTAASGIKKVGNTFLWDYYYKNESVHDQKDKNADTYLQYRQYYKEERSYAGYPHLAHATPYILGLPGKTYYEFDLSGKFEAQNTAVAISKIGKQTITFASNKGEHIAVSDNELKGTKVTYDGNDYYFMPSYMNKSLEADNSNYALNVDGNSYVKVTGEAKTVSAFRPYFTTHAVAHSRKFEPESIAFGGNYNGLEEEPISTLNGDLEIYVKDRHIVTTSHLLEATTVRIINVSGNTIANYVLQPGETVETPISIEGVYIANKKKLLVK